MDTCRTQCSGNTLTWLANSCSAPAARPQLQVPSHNSPTQTLLPLYIPSPQVLLQIRPLRCALGRSPFEVLSQAWQCAKSPDRGQHHCSHSCLRERGKITTHTSWTLAPPTKETSQGTIQGKCPALWCHCSPGKCLVWPNSSLTLDH